ncbi:MAG: hypothetical protein Q4E12_00060 [Coriobacteriia bacterium]|nr:hypothetical protein [Coriobacteriia bacterium]
MRNQRLINCTIAGIACFVVGAVVGVLVFSAQQQATPNQLTSPQVQPASNASVAQGNEEASAWPLMAAVADEVYATVEAN